jgi:hypothetical protein
MTEAETLRFGVAGLLVITYGDLLVVAIICERLGLSGNIKAVVFMAVSSVLEKRAGE